MLHRNPSPSTSTKRIDLHPAKALERVKIQWEASRARLDAALKRQDEATARRERRLADWVRAQVVTWKHPVASSRHVAANLAAAEAKRARRATKALGQ